MLASGLGAGAAQALTKVAMANEEKADCTSLTSPEPRGLCCSSSSNNKNNSEDYGCSNKTTTKRHHMCSSQFCVAALSMTDMLQYHFGADWHKQASFHKSVHGNQVRIVLAQDSTCWHVFGISHGLASSRGAKGMATQ